MEENISYTEAFEELQELVENLEDGEIAIDELSDKIKRALVLLDICKAKLHSTNEDVQKLLNDISIANEEDSSDDE